MYKHFFCTLFPVCFGCLVVVAQSNAAERVTENAKGKVEQRVNEKVDKAIDNLIDGKLFKRKNKENGKQDADTTDKAVLHSTGQNIPSDRINGAGQELPSIKAYSKFDFVPGEKIVYYDDFERVAVGDFPAEFNTNASGEVMTVDGKAGKWFSLTKNGSFLPEKIGVLPDNFTLEMHVGILDDPGNNMSGFGLHFNADKAQLFDYHFAQGSFVTLHPAGGSAAFSVYQAASDNTLKNEFKMPQWDLYANKNFARLSFWRQGSRLRVYVNENKLMDIPRFFPDSKPYYLAIFRDFFGDCNLLLTEVRLAAGQPDTRSKLITEGRFSTTGILFDYQKSTIRPESYQVLKSIAAALQENPGVKVQIVGHTSNDGDAGANLLLSKQRAAAVKETLIKEFGIAAERLETDGKGGAEPADMGTSPEAKANNRRVEFIKR